MMVWGWFGKTVISLSLIMKIIFLNDQQHGFRPNFSTSTAVFEMLKTSYKAWKKRMFQTCVFIDFSRLFDCIDHQILLFKLKLYGLDDRAQWYIYQAILITILKQLVLMDVSLTWRK